MPTYQRRYFLHKLIEENNRKQEVQETQTMNAGASKGTRTKRVSGDALKNMIKSGDLPEN